MKMYRAFIPTLSLIMVSLCYAQGAQNEAIKKPSSYTSPDLVWKFETGG